MFSKYLETWIGMYSVCVIRMEIFFIMILFFNAVLFAHIAQILCNNLYTKDPQHWICGNKKYSRGLLDYSGALLSKFTIRNFCACMQKHFHVSSEDLRRPIMHE